MYHTSKLKILNEEDHFEQALDMHSIGESIGAIEKKTLSWSPKCLS